MKLVEQQPDFTAAETNAALVNQRAGERNAFAPASSPERPFVPPTAPTPMASVLTPPPPTAPGATWSAPTDKNATSKVRQTYKQKGGGNTAL